MQSVAGQSDVQRNVDFLSVAFTLFVVLNDTPFDAESMGSILLGDAHVFTPAFEVSRFHLPHIYTSCKFINSARSLMDRIKHTIKKRTLCVFFACNAHMVRIHMEAEAHDVRNN